MHDFRKQMFHKSIQDYMMNFKNQVVGLDISLKDYAIYIKYVACLHKCIRKGLKFFSVDNFLGKFKVIDIEVKIRNITKG